MKKGRTKERKKERRKNYRAVIINRNADYGAFTVLFGTDSSHR